MGTKRSANNARSICSGSACFVERAPESDEVHVIDSDEARTHEPWTAVATERAEDGNGETGHKGRGFVVDFSGKPGKQPRYLTCVYVDRTLRWEDGNVWVQLYVHPSQVGGVPGRRGRDAV